MSDSPEIKMLSEKINEMSSEIKELTKALTQLIVLDSEMKVQNGALNRLGRQVDDHETRLRHVEVKGGINANRVSNNERIAWAIATGLLSLAFYFLRG